MSKRMNLAVIPGDGIGPEVVAEGVRVLRAAIEGQELELSLTPV